MSSVLKIHKEVTDLRRQFTVFPYYTGGQNQFFTASNNILYRIHADISNCDWVIARDMGSEMEISSVDPSIATDSSSYLQNDIGTLNIVKKGSARKFQVLSMYSGTNIENAIPTSDLYYDLSGVNPNLTQAYGNQAGNATAYSDSKNPNNLFDAGGYNAIVNDLLIVGGGSTRTTTSTQSLPFGTFWAVNDPIVISYKISGITKNRAIKNNINETTFFG